jgi:serine phosphatase RsbU (regulator of sigma subunit)
MASLRYAIRAFASQGDMPAAVLNKLTALLNVGRDDHFATVLCGVVDVSARTVIFANAGHPHPLVLDEHATWFLETNVGVPIGVKRHVEYESVTTTIPAGATLLMFTDGLFERRRESIDTGLERLRQSASQAQGSLQDLVAQIIAAQTTNSEDDTAILAVQWQNQTTTKLDRLSDQGTRNLHRA